MAGEKLFSEQSVTVRLTRPQVRALLAGVECWETTNESTWAVLTRAEKALKAAYYGDAAPESEAGDWTAGEIVRVQDAIERVLDEHNVGQDVTADPLYALTLAAIGETFALRPASPPAPGAFAPNTKPRGRTREPLPLEPEHVEPVDPKSEAASGSPS